MPHSFTFRHNARSETIISARTVLNIILSLPMEIWRCYGSFEYKSFKEFARISASESHNNGQESWWREESDRTNGVARKKSNPPGFRVISSASLSSRSSLLIFSSRKQVSSSRASRSFLFFVSFLRPQIHVSLQSQIRLLPEIRRVDVRSDGVPLFGTLAAVVLLSTGYMPLMRGNL